MYSGKADHIPHLIRIDSPFAYLLGPACFFYTYATFKPGFRFHWIYLLHLLPFIANLIEFTPFYLSDASTKVDYNRAFLETGTVIMPYHYLLKTISLFIYLFMQIYYFLKYKPLNKMNGVNRITVIWFRIFIIIQLISMTGLVADNLTGLHIFGDPYRFATLVITTFLYVVTITLLVYPQILYGISNDRFSNRSKYSHSRLNEEDKSAILDRLKAYLSDDRKVYCDANLSLPEVARRIEVGIHQLSQAINEKTGFNFNDYLNIYRIEEAKSLLSSKEYEKLTIDAIASKAGFQSKSTFYSAFKKHTGITPKQFAETIRSQ